MFERDIDILKQSVSRIIEYFDGRFINFIELGVYEGGTSKILINHILNTYSYFNYFGVDPGVNQPDISEHFYFINKPAHLALFEVPTKIQWVLLDNCHCYQCVYRDFLIYGSRLSINGEICFHDASLKTQGRDPQDYECMKDYHDEIKARNGGIRVRGVLDDNMKYFPNFELIEKALDQEFGGVEIYRRIF